MTIFNNTIDSLNKMQETNSFEYNSGSTGPYVTAKLSDSSDPNVSVMNNDNLLGQSGASGTSGALGSTGLSECTHCKRRQNNICPTGASGATGVLGPTVLKESILCDTFGSSGKDDSVEIAIISEQLPNVIHDEPIESSDNLNTIKLSDQSSELEETKSSSGYSNQIESSSQVATLGTIWDCLKWILGY